MNRAWSKYHLDCPYCNKKIKVHIIFKKENGIETVSERIDIYNRNYEVVIKNDQGVLVQRPGEKGT